ncbi:hypothetical protein N798_03470 [Knoellia flava TL1]|uniref:HTH luxR-type domain-containing protein n=2 Tax=Knoellia flava TaxID=913969 RepID=A0A8H9FV70_9MICO|nr:LuxR C-terminal-related transcriptional regulator [Knoellia flava]KGN35288.1 hypothetical protein N798_03470 [Knoellia flava TL1]GGB77795.1 hypothetical protein GCM10011314_16810 [Knoellia flava]
MEPSRLARSATDLAHAAAQGEPVLADVLHLLDRAVGADVLNSSVAVPLDGRASPAITMLHTPPLTAEEEAGWMRLIPTHPFARSLAGRGLRTARLTDTMSVRDLEALELWELLLEPRGSRYQLAATLQSDPAAFTLLSLWREHEDFTEEEAAVVELVRRALASALEFHAAMTELRALAGPPERSDVLTPRQAQVCALVARGLTNAQVATRLGLSERTVRKHVEDAFVRTGCTSRTALALWWRSCAMVADPPLSPGASPTAS